MHAAKHKPHGVSFCGLRFRVIRAGVAQVSCPQGGLRQPEHRERSEPAAAYPSKSTMSSMRRATSPSFRPLSMAVLRSFS